MSSKRRVYQIAEKIRECIALQLSRTADPRFSLVTITSVFISPDLRVARVYWLVSGAAERRTEAQEAFESASGMFRRAIGHELAMRFVPELRFFYDDTLDTAAEVEKLFARINSGAKS